MKKNFVLDTNVLMHCPDAIDRFEENDVWIARATLEELDGLKKERGETGYQAREAVRALKNARARSGSADGVPVGEGGTLRFLFEENWPNERVRYAKADDAIVAAALDLKARRKRNVTVVSNDVVMLLKAEKLGLTAQEYKNDRVTEDLYRGRREAATSADGIDAFYSEGKLSPEEVEGGSSLVANEYLVLRDWNGRSALAKFDGTALRPLSKTGARPCDLAPRNVGQTFLIDSCSAPPDEVPLTLCHGPAGTGKTLVALAVGLHETMEKKTYSGVLLCRANVTMGGRQEEIGFLPGDEREKIEPLFRAVVDNCKILFGNDDVEDKMRYLFDKKYLETQAVAYLRGRSITNTFVILDEAQNCTPTTIHSILTRVGSGTKIVAIGDPKQIDAPGMDERNNGLAFAVQAMKGSPLCDVTSFDESECVRSPLAKVASERMGGRTN